MEGGEAHKGWNRLLRVPGEPEVMPGRGSHTHSDGEDKHRVVKNVPFRPAGDPRVPRVLCRGDAAPRGVGDRAVWWRWDGLWLPWLWPALTRCLCQPGDSHSLVTAQPAEPWGRTSAMQRWLLVAPLPSLPLPPPPQYMSRHPKTRRWVACAPPSIGPGTCLGTPWHGGHPHPLLKGGGGHPKR